MQNLRFSFGACAKSPASQSGGTNSSSLGLYQNAPAWLRTVPNVSGWRTAVQAAGRPDWPEQSAASKPGRFSFRGALARRTSRGLRRWNLIHRGAAFKVCEESRYRHTSSSKHPGAAYAIAAPFDLRAGAPVDHGESPSHYRPGSLRMAPVRITHASLTRAPGLPHSARRSGIPSGRSISRARRLRICALIASLSSPLLVYQ